MRWVQTSDLGSKTYKCGYCNFIVASSIGYYTEKAPFRIFICSNCKLPSFFDSETQIPGTTIGDEVANLPKEVESLYKEARQILTINSYTASVLASRKLLMNIAVAKGAKLNQRFIEYVDYLTIISKDDSGRFKVQDEQAGSIVIANLERAAKELGLNVQIRKRKNYIYFFKEDET